MCPSVYKPVSRYDNLEITSYISNRNTDHINLNYNYYTQGLLIWLAVFKKTCRDLTFEGLTKLKYLAGGFHLTSFTRFLTPLLFKETLPDLIHKTQTNIIV